MTIFSYKRTITILLLCCGFSRFTVAQAASSLSLQRVGGVAAVSAVLAYLHRQSSQSMSLSPRSVFTPARGSLVDQTIVITGGTTGLGLESAKRLAYGGATIILTARTAAKGQAAVTAVKEYLQRQYEKDEKNAVNNNNKHDDARISFKILDLDDLQSVKNLVAEWEQEYDATPPNRRKRIDILLNNAGIMALPKRELTKDGFERQFQSNHLGHFVFTALLANKLLNDTARIINISSEAHKMAFWTGLDLDYAWRAEPPESYGGWKSYGQSKLANILFTQELQRRVDAANAEVDCRAGGSGMRDWTVVAVHPGAVATDLARNIMGVEAFEQAKAGQATWFQQQLLQTIALFIKTVEQGANTQVWLAAQAETVNVRGRYLADFQLKILGDYANDRVAAARLWKESEELSGVVFDVQSCRPTTSRNNR